MSTSYHKDISTNGHEDLVQLSEDHNWVLNNCLKTTEAHIHNYEITFGGDPTIRIPLESQDKVVSSHVGKVQVTLCWAYRHHFNTSPGSQIAVHKNRNQCMSPSQYRTHKDYSHTQNTSEIYFILFCFVLLYFFFYFILILFYFILFHFILCY